SKIISNTQKSFKDILNFIPDPTLAIDRSGKVIYWNRAIEKMTGVKAEDMIGRGNYEYALPFYGVRRPILLNFIFKYQKDLEKKYHFIKRAGVVLTTEADVPVRGGKPRVLWAKASPLYDSEGKIIGAIESIRDITDRKIEEQKLKESESRFKGYFNMSGAGIAITSPEKGWIEVNKELCLMLGYSRSEILSKTWSEMTYPDDLAADVKQFDRILSGKIDSYNLDKRFIRKDKKVVWTNISVGCVRESNGNVDYIIALLVDISDRKNSELKLKESHRRYKMIVDNVNDAFYLHDFKGRILDTNENACKMTGYTRNELIGANASIVDTPEQAEFIPKRIQRLIKAGKLLFESQHRRKDGTYFWVSVSAKIVSREDGGLIEAFVRDITDQKQNEERLKESEERYRNLISNLPKTEYVLVHRKGELLWVNDNTVSFLGRSKKEIIGSSVFDYLEKKYQKIVLENINKRAAGKKVGDYEIKIKNKKGEQRNVLVRGSSVNYEGWPAILLVLSDITDMVKKDEELVSVNNKLEQSREAILNVLKDIEEQRDISYKQNIELAKFKLAVDNASDDIIITDSKGVILYANFASEKNNGYSINEIIGKTPAIWGKQMPKEFYENFWKTIKEDKKSCICEVINKRKNGELYTAEIRVSPIVNDRNEVEFFVGISHDITKLKELDRAKSEFVSVASHQLKTPVSGMKWMLESILKNRENNLTEKQITDLKDVYENNERMIGLINDLLNISRIDSGKYALLNLAKTEVVPMIERAIKESSQFANDRKVKIVFHDHLPLNYSINIDHDKIYQAILNLIFNSIKYSKFEGGVSEITTELKNGEFIFSIKDNGIGIPLKNQRYIFEKFYRAENASTSQASGSGLGLYIGKYFIESHKGRVWFDSKEGVGTTFTFTLRQDLI
ncbi:MAG: PAS domain S-box protein, partial [Minisyncoccota bacterium]